MRATEAELISRKLEQGFVECLSGKLRASGCDLRRQVASVGFWLTIHFPTFASRIPYYPIRRSLKDAQCLHSREALGEHLGTVTLELILSGRFH